MIESVKRLYENNKSPVMLFGEDRMLLWHNSAADTIVETGQVESLYRLCFSLDLTKEKEKLENGLPCHVAGNPALGVGAVLLQPLEGADGSLLLAVLSIQPQNWTLPGIEHVVSVVEAQYRDSIFAIHNMLGPVKKDLEKHDCYDSCMFVDRIGNQCYRTMRITSNLANYFKYSAVDVKMNKVRVNLNHYVEELCRMVRNFIVRTPNSFRYEICPESIISVIDPKMLSVAFYNLIVNSCLYANPENEIVVRLEKINGEYAIIVSDKGVGIPEKIQPHVFEPFYSHDPNGSPACGAGLGLSIVKRVAELHGGDCILTGEWNEGTTVAIRLPITDDPDGAVVESPCDGEWIDRFSPLYLYLTDVCGINTVTVL